MLCKKKNLKKVFLRVSEISREKRLCWILFLMKLPALWPESLLKGGSDEEVSLYDFRNSCENRLDFIGLTQI